MYRRIEVSHIQTALRLCRQRMIFQGYNDAVALLFDVRLSAETRGRQFNNAGIACAFAEIDIGGRNGLISLSSARGRRRSRTFICNGCIGLVSRFVYEYPNFVAANLSIVLADFVQTQNHACAVVVLCRSNLIQQGVGIFQNRLGQTDIGVGKIQCNTRRSRCYKTMRCGDVFVETDFDDFLVVRQSGNVDIGNIACKGRLNSEGNAEAGK